jgi:hypothetical protein
MVVSLIGQPGMLLHTCQSGQLKVSSALVAADTIKHPREAVRAISKRWLEASDFMKHGEEHPDCKIGTDENQKELAPLLEKRAKILAEWASNDAMWDEDDAP